MIIALFPHSKKKESKHLAIGIREYLTSRGAKVVTEDAYAESIGAIPLSEVSTEDIEFLISMGGDGTILRLVHQYPHINGAIIGINLGHLGFMADIPVSEIYPSLQDLLLGHFTIQERVVLYGSLAGKSQEFAVNDIVVHRGQNPTLVELGIHVGGTYLNTFVADGIIVATPNGSTAYSLAAGGPILTPSLNAVALTPISPHTISNRPIVLSTSEEIQIQVLSQNKPLEVSFDGMAHSELCTGDTLTISESPKRFRLVKLHRHDYYSTLRQKLSWTGKLK